MFERPTVFERPIEMALEESVRDVLETMFFVDVQTAAPGASAGGPGGIAAQVMFDGDPPDNLRLDLDLPAAQALVAGFSGDGDGRAHMEEVVFEMANMICGSVLSRIESSSVFRLASPQIAGDALPCPPELAEASFLAAVGGGALRVEIRMERTVCPGFDEPEY